MSRTVPHIEPLTVLRGVLAWWVVCYHFRESIAALVPPWVLHVMANGDLAVDAFFVLSGFVLYINHAGKVSASPRGGAAAFYVARFARVYPLHLFMLLCFIPVALAIRFLSSARDLGERYDLGYFAMSLVLVQNWGFTSQLGWNAPAWSISTEAFAYLLFPLIALFLCRPLRGSFAGILALGAGSAIALALALTALGAGSLTGAIPRLGLLRCVLEFVIGCSVGALVELRPRQALSVRLMLLAGAVAALAATLLDLAADHWVMPAAFGALIYALASGRATIRDGLSGRALIWLGQISYATYMVHYFVKDVVRFAMPTLSGVEYGYFLLYLALTLLMSAACYYGIEMPAGRMIRGWAERRVVRVRLAA